MNSKELIVKRLTDSDIPLACHELNIIGYNQNNLATRLSELSAAGIISGEIRSGTHYKHWKIKKPNFDSTGQGSLFLDDKDFS